MKPSDYLIERGYCLCSNIIGKDMDKLFISKEEYDDLAKRIHKASNISSKVNKKNWDLQKEKIAKLKREKEVYKEEYHRLKKELKKVYIVVTPHEHGIEGVFKKQKRCNSFYKI